jgi:hypothetical protein
VTLLNDHQFEILPDAEASDGFVFGIGADISVSNEGFDPGEHSWFTQDGDNTRRGVRGFGRDVPTYKTWTWSSHTDVDSESKAVDVLDDFADAWSPEALSLEPGEVTALRYRIAGRDRRVFGRPRRYAAPPNNLILSGYVDVTHDFETVDAYTYDDVKSGVSIPFSTAAIGAGFVLGAVTMPLLTQRGESASGQQQITVGGKARAYPVIRFNGPWTNPSLETDAWTLNWKGQIAQGDWVEIDARPWKLTVLNQDGASAVDGLDRRVWLEDLWFAPGSRPILRVDGIASPGASADVWWRNTWKSI